MRTAQWGSPEENAQRFWEPSAHLAVRGASRTETGQACQFQIEDEALLARKVDGNRPLVQLLKGSHDP
jgi:hypothetical protein